MFIKFGGPKPLEADFLVSFPQTPLKSSFLNIFSTEICTTYSVTLGLRVGGKWRVQRTLTKNCKNDFTNDLKLTNKVD